MMGIDQRPVAARRDVKEMLKRVGRTGSFSQLTLARIPMTLNLEQFMYHFYSDRAPADVEFWRR